MLNHQVGVQKKIIKSFFCVSEAGFKLSLVIGEWQDMVCVNKLEDYGLRKNIAFELKTSHL